jgi:BirA family biotin operon repressor/biotin-[acetyl-CoA-carboxylase] ligase
MAGPIDRDHTYGFFFGGDPAPTRGPTWEPGMPWPFVKAVIDREELASTNDLGRGMAQSGWSAFPLLIRARRQTRGRGRAGGDWWSDAGSLTFSVVLDPTDYGLTERHLPCVALAAAVAVVEAVSEYVPPGRTLGIRWPNDVESGGRKLCGILPERVEFAQRVYLVIGIGINVQTRLKNAPAEVQKIAASLADEAPSVDDCPTPDRVLAAVLAGLESVIPRLGLDDPSLAEHWASLDLLRDQFVRVDLGTRVVEGAAVGIDAHGHLLVRTPHDPTPVAVVGGRVLRG